MDARTFFNPDIIQAPAYRPFFLSERLLYEGEQIDRTTAALCNEANLSEWMGFFSGKVRREDWSFVLYKADLGQLDDLIFTLKGKAKALPKELAGSSLLSYPDRPLLVHALYYVGFAKRVETYALEREDYWEWERTKDNLDADSLEARARAIRGLIDGGRKAAEDSRVPALRARYLFQVLRLYYYSGEHEQCVSFQAKNAKALQAAAGLSWRALGYAAGSLYQLKRFAEANYRYALVYDGYPPLKRVAYLCFRPQEEEDWQQCLALARSPREKAVLWHLLGIYADGLRALREIYALAPSSDLLPLLVVREVSKAELAFDRSPEPPPRQEEQETSPPVAPETLEFLRSKALAEKGSRPWLWHLAAAHLLVLADDHENARMHLGRAARLAPRAPAVQEQLTVTDLFGRVQGLTRPDRALEPRLVRDLPRLTNGGARARTFNAWALGRLAVLYGKAGQDLVARCLQDRNAQNGGSWWVQEKEFYRSNGNLDRLSTFLAKPGKSPFEGYAAGIYRFGKDELTEFKAVNLFYQGDLTGSAAQYRMLKGGGGPLEADPFVIHVNDCHDCDAADPKKRAWTKAAFVARLGELKRAARQDSPSAAQACFELANGLYNATYYGNSRVFYDVTGEVFRGDRRHYDCSRAESWYRRAMKLATDKEFKAKACFMAAKCEQNAFYNEPKEGPEPGELFGGGTYFETLLKSYSRTKYFQEILRECGYFAQYVKDRR